MRELRARLDARAAELGFLACGVADLGPSVRQAELDTWLDAGHGGTMRYLHRQARKRKYPAEIVPGATAAVMVLDNYLPPGSWKPVAPGDDGPLRQADGPAPASDERFHVAKYALGRDYHRELTERLERLADTLREAGASIARVFADAGPVPERELAERAGLGWIGKNGMLIRPGVGSFFLVGAILTDVDLDSPPPRSTDHCGTCTRCLEACPTDAFVAPRVLDATRCISYLTIESRAPIPDDLADRLQGWAFGCDICNDVCPWNERFAEPTANPAYHDRGTIDRGDADFFERLTLEGFNRLFGDTPLERPGLEGMRRNTRAATRS